MTPRPPKRTHGCPMYGGRVVPFVAVQHTSGLRPPLFGLNDPRHLNTCYTEKRCGTCGGKLSDRPGGKFALILRMYDLASGYTPEPALHPSDCAPYTALACPALAGDMTHNRRSPRDLAAERCGRPDCDCRLWAPVSSSADRAGDLIPPFWMGVYRQEDYRPHWTEDEDNDCVELRGVAIPSNALSLHRITPPADEFDILRSLLPGVFTGPIDL